MQSGELNKMLPKILSQDSNYDEWCEQEILNAYKEAAECDEYLFGDYDYCKEWVGITTLNSQIEEVALLFFYAKKSTHKRRIESSYIKIKRQIT